MKYFNSIIIILVTFSVGIESYFWITATAPLGFMLSKSIIERIICYFSFFTVLSSITLAIGCGFVISKPYYRQQVITVLRLDGVIGVMITGLVYNLVLRSIYHPELTILKITNECLHVVIPILGVVGWLIFDPHSRINKRTIFYSTFAPIGYVIYIYMRGAITGWYPYPILNVNEIGYGQALLNTLIIAVIFILFAILLYVIDKRLPLKANNKS